MANIIRETSKGTELLPVADVLLDRRTVFLTDPVDAADSQHAEADRQGAHHAQGDESLCFRGGLFPRFHFFAHKCFILSLL